MQHHIDALAADLSKSLKKELHDSGTMCQAQFGDLCNQLADKKAQITTRTEMYQKVRLARHAEGCTAEWDNGTVQSLYTFYG